MIKLLWGTITIDYKRIWYFIVHRLDYLWWRLFHSNERALYLAEIESLRLECDGLKQQIKRINKRTESKDKLKARIKELETQLSQIEQDENRTVIRNMQNVQLNSQLEETVGRLQLELANQKFINDRLINENGLIKNSE